MSRKRVNITQRLSHPLLEKEHAFGCIVLGRRVALLLSSFGDEAWLKEMPASAMRPGVGCAVGRER